MTVDNGDVSGLTLMLGAADSWVIQFEATCHLSATPTSCVDAAAISDIRSKPRRWKALITVTMLHDNIYNAI